MGSADRNERKEGRDKDTKKDKDALEARMAELKKAHEEMQRRRKSKEG